MKNPTAALDPFRPFGPLQVFYVEPLMPFRWPMDSFPMAGYGLVVSMCWKSTLNRMTPIERVVLERTADRRCFGDLSALVLGRCFPIGDHDMFASAKVEFLSALAPQSYWVCSKSSDPPKDSLNFSKLLPRFAVHHGDGADCASERCTRAHSGVVDDVWVAWQISCPPTQGQDGPAPQALSIDEAVLKGGINAKTYQRLVLVGVNCIKHRYGWPQTREEGSIVNMAKRFVGLLVSTDCCSRTHTHSENMTIHIYIHYNMLYKLYSI